MIRIAPSLCALLLLASLAAAQDAPVRIEPGVSESGEPYAAAVRWRRVQHAVQYFDPDGPAPAANLRLREREFRRRADAPAEPIGLSRGVGIALTLLIVTGTVLLVLRFGGLNTLGLGAPERATQRSAKPGDEARDIPSRGLADILTVRDRAEAVHMLLAAALVRAAAQVDLYLHPSWTARDILRRIPAGWAGRGALGELTRVAEEVHFGGRAISDAEFDHVAQAVAPLFAGEEP